MGIKNLSALLNLYAPKSITKKQFTDLSGKKIAIDASLLIYSYVIAIRNSSYDLTNTDGDMTSHIHAVVSKTLLYLDNSITPIFVFDGKPPNLKNSVLDKRKEIRQTAKKLLDDASDDETDKKIKLFKKTTVITSKQMDQCKEGSYFCLGKFDHALRLDNTIREAAELSLQFDLFKEKELKDDKNDKNIVNIRLS